MAGLLAASAAFNAVAGRAALAELRADLGLQSEGLAALRDRTPDPSPRLRAIFEALDGPRDPRPTVAAVRPGGPVPWERLVALRYSSDPRLGGWGGETVVVYEVTLVRERPRWTFAREVRPWSETNVGNDAVALAGLTDDPRVRAWRAWCRFPSAEPRSNGTLHLGDVPFLPDHPWGRRPVFVIPLTADAAAVRPAWWPPDW